jgi:epoxyqueuosine reductase
MHPPDTALLSSRIRDEARRLGFFKVGIAAVRPLPYPEHFRAWLREGMNGEMGYMKNQALKRQDPRLLLDGARSMLVLAMDYFTGDTHAESPLRGRIGRYARGGDYHKVITDRLHSLLEWIRNEAPQARGICYVDTGPIMEKAWGSQAALGWMGKHTNLITREIGSWFFIGVILTSLDLEYDSNVKDLCGTCSRCISACPTGAIVAPYVVDARLCISYLTIELRGAIPHKLRPLLGNRIYGCDDCQEVCPWNRFAVTASEREFFPRKENLMPELAPLVRITAQEFKERFKNSAIRRATRDAFVRNVVVALGNSRSSEAISALEGAIQDESTLVRSHAAWALGRIASERARHVLELARTKEADRAVLEEITLALPNG